jgi:hypothetical protein
LNAVRVFEAAQLAKFGGREAVVGLGHRYPQFRRLVDRTALTT